MSSRWWVYVLKVRAARGLNQAETAAQMGVNPTVLSNWRAGTGPSAQMVIKFARATEENPLVALVEAGYLTPEEAAIRTVVRFEDRLVNLKTEQLLAELGRRAGIDFR